MSKDLFESLVVVLANQHALALKTQNYHWNVTGANFQSLHSLFEDQYKDLSLAIDDLAERIRAIGYKTPASWDAYSPLVLLANGFENADANTMLKDLSKDQGIMLDILHRALSIAQEMQDEVTADLLIGRLAEHEKNTWVLSSTIV